MISNLDLIILAIAAFITSIFGGVAGGGTIGFIMTPLAIALGLSPAQAVANGKINGLFAAIGSLSGLRSKVTKSLFITAAPFMVLALLIGLLVPYIIIRLDSELYKTILGIIILIMIPIMIKKKLGLKTKRVTLFSKILGYGAISASMFLLGVFSGGLGTLVNVSLMGLFGMDALAANIVKRLSQVLLNITVAIGLVGSDLFVWKILLITTPIILIGTHIGGRMAIKKGNKFIMDITVLFMAISGLFLILS